MMGKKMWIFYGVSALWFLLIGLLASFSYDSSRKMEELKGWSSVSNEIRNYQARIGQIEDMVSARKAGEKSSSEIISGLSSAAKENHLDSVRIDNEEIKKPNGSGEMTVHIGIRGRFADIGEYLQKLEKAGITVKQLSISREGNILQADLGAEIKMNSGGNGHE